MDTVKKPNVVNSKDVKSLNAPANGDVKKEPSMVSGPLKRPRGRPRRTDTEVNNKPNKVAYKRRKFDGPYIRPPNSSDFGPVTENNGFSRGLKPERIICGFIRDKQLYFVFKFRNTLKREIVTTHDLKEHAPQMLIKYYQAHFKFKPAK